MASPLLTICATALPLSMVGVDLNLRPSAPKAEATKLRLHPNDQSDAPSYGANANVAHVGRLTLGIFHVPLGYKWM